MKKIISSLLAFSMLLMAYVPVIAEDAPWKEFYVSENGSDENPGTKDAPFASVHRAQKAVREVNKDMEGDIVVNIEEGHYFMPDTLDMRSEDSGFNGHRVIWRGVGDKKPTISAGERVTGFKETGKNGIYVADYDTDMGMVLQLSVNDEVRLLAKTNDFVQGCTKPDVINTEDWYMQNPLAPKDAKYNYYNPETKYEYDGFYMSKEDIALYKNAGDMFMRWDTLFYSTVIKVHALEACEDPDKVRVVMEPGQWNTYLQQGANHLPRADREFHVYNALELLDEPGEFYYDRHAKKLYYMPMEGENMDEAIVVAARHSMGLLIDGYDVDNKVKNLTFENLAFSDSRWDLYTNSFTAKQASVWIAGGDSADYIPACVFMQRADNIEFKDNIVRNTGAGGVFIYNGVTNLDFVGNVIHDTGDVGVGVGAANHSDMNLDRTSSSYPPDPYKLTIKRDTISEPVPEEYKDYPVEIGLLDGTRVFTSYAMDDRNVTGVTALWGNITRAHPDNRWYGGAGHIRAVDETWDQNYKLYNVYWKDDYTCEDGKLPWARWEFLRPYSIDEVVVSFTEECGKIGGNQNYQILLSNDRDFGEGTYVVAAEQKGAAPEEINHYKIDEDAKYRYMMIRKTVAEPLALSKVWIQTYDIKPYVKNERCQYINISNNLITRCGGHGMEHANGIFISSFENSKVNHNEIEKVGYTGIASGFQWSTHRSTCWDSEIAYNRIHDTGQNLLDGGPIYTLGAQPGCTIHHNFLSRPNHGIRNLYSDNGTSYMDIHNNYAELGRYSMGPYVQWTTPQSSSHQVKNVWHDNYSTFSQAERKSLDVNTWEEPHLQVIGQPTKDSYDVYANAGLEEEYKDLWELVPDITTFTYHHYDSNVATYTDENAAGFTERYANLQEELDGAIKGAKFGTGLGVYPVECEKMFQDALNYLVEGEQPDQIKRLTATEEFIDDIKKMMNRYSFSDTLKMCEDIISQAKADSTLYPQDAIDRFTKTVEEVKNSKDWTEYTRLSTLENAYNEISTKKSSTNIKAVMVDGADKVEIDEENRYITVYMPLGASYQVENIQITPDGAGKLACVFAKKTDISKEIDIPIYNPTAKEYVSWTLKGEETPIPEGGITGDVWTYNTNEKTFTRKALDGSVTLRALNYAYMSTVTGGDKATKMKIAPMSPNEIKEFTLILGANMAEDFDYGNTNEKYNRCEVVFKNDSASFYKVVGGKKTLINEVSSGLDWNAENDLEYQIKEINDNTHFRITLNGKTIISTVIKKCSYGRYIGFYSPKVSIRVY